MKFFTRFTFVAAVFVFTSSIEAQAPRWSWVRQDQVLNPSGLEAASFAAQFNTLDWNNDRIEDFVVNDSTTAQLFVGSATAAGIQWKRTNTLFPAIGTFNFGREIPRAFQFVDFDHDGDFDLAADEGQFWWNTGSNAIPKWFKDDSVLSAVRLQIHYDFVDYDNDGDWDMTADNGYYGPPRLYLQTTRGSRPRWVADSTVLNKVPARFLFKPLFREVNNDGTLDLLALSVVPVDPGGCYEALLHINRGTLFSPLWQPRPLSRNFRALWCGLGPGITAPDYQLVDFDHDGDDDLLTRDALRHFALYKNSGGLDSLWLDLEHPQLLGAVNAESNAIPFLFDYRGDGVLDLILSEDFAYSFTISTFFHEGRFVSFAANNIGFDLNDPNNNWFKNPYPIQVVNFAKRFHLSFSDFDHDGDSDYLFSYYQISPQDAIIGSRVLFFRNWGANVQPDWKPDSSLFAPFDQSPQRFWAPQLIDIDRDGDDDMLIKRGSRFVFYENVSMGLPLVWREQPQFMAGLSDTSHYLAAIADLTRDALPDLIFGEEDGTLRLYENAGTVRAPAWRYVAQAFAGIDVGNLAAPVLGDLNADNRLDLLVGNAEGRVFFYRNESTVAVQETKTALAPASFALFQNYPNPLHVATRAEISAAFQFQLPQRSQVTLTIYNIAGQKVRTLVDRRCEIGAHQIVWDGRNEAGQQIASGVYFARLQAVSESTNTEFVQVRKVVLIE
jgi:hypothetical protein